MICKQNSFFYSYGPLKISASTEGLLNLLARDLNNMVKIILVAKTHTQEMLSFYKSLRAKQTQTDHFV